MLEGSKISREHAVVVWSETEERPSLVDLGSANGVTMDGIRVQGSRVLGFMGTIQIGPMKIGYELEDAGSDIATSFNLPDDSESFVLERGEQFAGEFEDADEMKDTLRGLERAKRSGSLRISSGKHEGLVQFAQGKVMSAAWGRLRGLTAMERIIELDGGQYVMASRLVPSDEFLNLSIAEFLDRGF